VERYVPAELSPFRLGMLFHSERTALQDLRLKQILGCFESFAAFVAFLLGTYFLEQGTRALRYMCMCDMLALEAIVRQVNMYRF
jgi:hypothetical protein